MGAMGAMRWVPPLMGVTHRILCIHTSLRADREIHRSRSSMRLRKERSFSCLRSARLIQRATDVGCFCDYRARSVERSP